MGCVSSKLVRKRLVREIRVNNGGDHIVSLTSTTYGHLDLDQRGAETSPKSHELNKGLAFESEPIKPRRSTAHGDDPGPEIINTWELMKDLEDSMKISPKSRGILSWKTPAKSSLESPKRNGGSSKRFRGKENRGLSPNQVPKRGVMRLSFPLKTEEASVAVTQRRKSFSPMFDPELVASYERELSQEKEQIKMVISSSGKTEKNRESERLLSSFPEKCPPGGEDTVVVYITTLRGIRKTFEDCNAVRSVLDSHEVRFSERDVSMHSVFKEEIRGILGKVKIPAVFVKGRMVGSAEEVMRLEEEGKLGILLECMPKQRLGGGCCCGCGGMRFVMCDVCNGSCKVIDGEKKNTVVKCLVCNENGLVLCPICS